jgi:hypothetical protein
MIPEIRYADKIIVGVVYKAKWFWYVSEKEFWFMDLVKLNQAFLKRGYTTDMTDFSARFNIPIVNEETVEQFLVAMAPYQTDVTTLSIIFVNYLPAKSWDDIIEMCPSLLLDFDRKKLWSLFPEPASFENYVPDGWQGEYADFLQEVPKEQKYWIIDGNNYFEKFVNILE